MEGKVSAKEKILETAAKVFAEKSFDGARMDEIAKEAGVPKSLIYYHFKSKDEILQVLSKRFVDTYQQMISKAKTEEDAYGKQKLGERMKTLYYPFGMENENLVRVLLIEAVKKSNQETAFFEMVGCLLHDRNRYTSKDINTDKNIDNHGVRIVDNCQTVNSDYKYTNKELDYAMVEFFFNIIPCIAYLCFAKGWCEYFQMKKEDFDKTFLQQYSNIHGNYHKTL